MILWSSSLSSWLLSFELSTIETNKQSITECFESIFTYQNSVNLLRLVNSRWNSYRMQMWSRICEVLAVLIFGSIECLIDDIRWTANYAGSRHIWIHFLHGKIWHTDKRNGQKIMKPKWMTRLRILPVITASRDVSGMTASSSCVRVEISLLLTSKSSLSNRNKIVNIYLINVDYFFKHNESKNLTTICFILSWNAVIHSVAYRGSLQTSRQQQFQVI